MIILNRTLRTPLLLQRLIPLSVSLMLSGAAMASVAEIVSLTGNTDYRLPAEEKWQPAKLNQKLDNGQYLRTGANSSMALLLEDKTQVRLAPHSIFQFKESDPKSGGTKLNLRQGRAWAQTKSLPGTLQMETPSAVLAINGTDWEMEVDEEGRTRLTVLHGVVELYNEHGSVTVRNNESALAEKGKAPVKYLLQNPAERVQWVTSYTIDAARYPELNETATGSDSALREIAALIRSQNLDQAHDKLRALEQSAPRHSPAVYLLLADFAIVEGELGKAEAALRQGRAHFPDEARLDAHWVRVMVLRGQPDAARKYLDTALRQHPGAVELRLVQGELARFEGDAAQAAFAYRTASELSPHDARGWHGQGVVESEKENIKQARPYFDKALDLDVRAAATRGELATLETFANKLDAARQQFDFALQERPDDYVALTGLGLLQLKSGQTEAALETLLKASVIEPKYARAVIYTAIAYYQLGRRRTALEALERASELDPRDPLPHQLASLIHIDNVEPGRAVDAAREAMRLMPFLKSLNQIANDQKGAANLGNALAQFGLEDWAMNYAQQSYNPFWAGSHLFLADRYDGKFAKQSELMQGYLTDPTAFGASNRFQTLLPRPGNHVSAGLAASRSDEQTSVTPSVVVNGYANGSFPIAYFGEAMRIDLRPGTQPLEGNGNNITAAIGMAPREDIGVFAFANSFNADIAMQETPQIASRINGRENRLELGINYKHSASAQSWLKVGNNDESATVVTADDSGASRVNMHKDYQPRSVDVQFRHSVRADANEWTWGAEHGTTKLLSRLISSSIKATTRDETRAQDESRSLYVEDRHTFNAAWRLDAGLFYQQYDKQENGMFVGQQGSIVFAPYVSSDAYSRRGVFPRLGLVFTPQTGTVWRLAYQHWLRPTASNSLGPVATAGIPLDDRVVLPGGELKRLRLQMERELSANSFAMLFVDAKNISNLGEAGNVLNQREDVADLDRLRNRASLVFQYHAETLEQPAIFQQGRIRSAGGALNQRWSDSISSFAGYAYTDSENTADGWSGLKLPYLPRHRATLGITWVGPQRLVLQGAATYRSARYIDEHHSTELAAGWDMALKASWQSPDKSVLLEAYAMNLLKQDVSSVVGVNAVWRF